MFLRRRLESALRSLWCVAGGSQEAPSQDRPLRRGKLAGFTRLRAVLREHLAQRLRYRILEAGAILADNRLNDHSELGRHRVPGHRLRDVLGHHESGNLFLRKLDLRSWRDAAEKIVEHRHSHRLQSGSRRRNNPVRSPESGSSVARARVIPIPSGDLQESNEWHKPRAGGNKLMVVGPEQGTSVCGQNPIDLGRALIKLNQSVGGEMQFATLVGPGIGPKRQQIHR